jgi:hypothetical protein
MNKNVIIADGINRAKSFIDSETKDYSMKYEITNAEFYNDSVYVYIDFDKNSVELKISEMEVPEDEEDIHRDCKIEVCMYEDVYEEVKDYDFTIKYFWMALLSWD